MPDKSYVTVKTRLYNPSNAMQTFHWSANLAVHANEEYQLQFPPDIDYITYHYKDAVSEFPVVKGEFARADFGEGTDITWFKNIPSPASFFILNSDYNFMAGFDHGRQRGTVHVADHNVSVGKKFFTWGSREFGDVWHRNLTDEDGAYLEIMTGCYTDNQPDFSFIAPDETKTFEQTWYATAHMPGLKNAEKDVSLFLLDESGKTLVSYTFGPSFFQDREKPVPHRPARKPEEIPSQEELYLEGLHLEQYRHVTLRAEDYYREALRRDNGDIRCNNGMGLLWMRRGDCKKALPFFEKAVKRSMLRNPNPRDGEYCFNYAWALENDGQEEEAIRFYRKAAWNYGYKGAGLKQAAKLYVRKGCFEDALSCIKEELTVNGESPELSFLKAFILRKSGRSKEAGKVVRDMLAVDPLGYGLLGESWFLQNEKEALDRLKNVLRERKTAWRVLMAEYLELRAWQEVLALGRIAPADPMNCYYRAYAAAGLGKEAEAADFLTQAGEMSPDYCFPYTDMDRRVLQYAFAQRKDGGKSAYYLGCLFYGRVNREEGVKCWEVSVTREDGLYQAHRCMALALLEVFEDKVGARREMEKAFAMHQDGRYLLELMEIRRESGVPVEKLLELLEAYPQMVYRREDLYHQQLVLYNGAGMPEKAAYLKNRAFNPYEGGEGILVKAHILAYIQMGRRAFREKDYDGAIAFYKTALEYPENYQEGRGVTAREAAALYLSMLDGADAILKEEDRFPYFGGFVSNLPGEHSVKKANHRKTHPARFYALTGLGRKQEARKEKELGMEWMRLNICFPWKDKMFGTLSEEYIAARQEIRDTHAKGFQVMPATPPLGGFTYDEGEGKTCWHEHFPEFVGKKGTEEFYENVRESMRFICEDLGEAAGIYWQCMNEIDIPVFSNDYPDDILADTARACAEGIRRGNPEARCGINISCYNENAVRIADLVYREGHSFYYMGVDQYFGSWQPGDAENWIGVLDALYERYRLPVLANEWGYSSAGELAEEMPDPALVPKGLPEVCYVKKWFHEVKGGHTPEVQADYFRRGHRIFAQHPHCLGSFMFCWRDAYHCYHCGASDCPAECYWGIVDTQCRPKPAYYAVKEALAEYYKD